MVRAHVKQGKGAQNGRGVPEKKRNEASTTDEVDEWPCRVDGCTKIFQREADLKRHQRTSKLHAVPGDQRDIICPTCRAFFTRADALRRHQKTRNHYLPPPSSDDDSMSPVNTEAGNDNIPQAATTSVPSAEVTPSTSKVTVEVANSVPPPPWLTNVERPPPLNANTTNTNAGVTPTPQSPTTTSIAVSSSTSPSIVRSMNSPTAILPYSMHPWEVPPRRRSTIATSDPTTASPTSSPVTFPTTTHSLSVTTVTTPAAVGSTPGEIAQPPNYVYMPPFPGAPAWYPNVHHPTYLTQQQQQHQLNVNVNVITTNASVTPIPTPTTATSNASPSISPSTMSTPRNPNIAQMFTEAGLCSPARSTLSMTSSPTRIHHHHLHGTTTTVPSPHLTRPPLHSSLSSPPNVQVQYMPTTNIFQFPYQQLSHAYNTASIISPSADTNNAQQLSSPVAPPVPTTAQTQHPPTSSPRISSHSSPSSSHTIPTPPPPKSNSNPNRAQALLASSQANKRMEYPGMGAFHIDPYIDRVYKSTVSVIQNQNQNQNPISLPPSSPTLPNIQIPSSPSTTMIFPHSGEPSPLLYVTPSLNSAFPPSAASPRHGRGSRGGGGVPMQIETDVLPESLNADISA